MRQLLSRFLESPTVYATWQSPFADDKIAPVLETDAYQRAERVLDVGCGPGTSASHFAHATYVGVDLNPRYIEYASKRFPGRFLVADVTEGIPGEKESFDFILMNSLLHHLSDERAEALLGSLAPLLHPNGTIHILDLVLPEESGAARWLARRDRGEWPRPTEHWNRLFSSAWIEEEFRVYPLTLVGVELWRMVYFRGRTKS